MERTIIDVRKEVILKDSNYATIAKAVVAAIAELTPLQITTVTADTSGIYTAVLSLEGYPYPFLAGNNGRYFYLGLSNDAGSGWLASSSMNLTASYRTKTDGTGEYYADIRIVFSSIGSIINGLQINNGPNYMLAAVFSWAVSEVTGEKIGIFYSSSSTGGTWDSYIFPNRGGTEYSIYANALTSSISKDPYDTNTYLTPAAVGAEYVWVPIRTFGYLSPSVWFGRLLWGGKYTMYRLCTPSFTTHVSVIPSVNYVVDGQIYRGCFNELLDLREG